MLVDDLDSPGRRSIATSSGEHRLGELKLAMEHLGVTDFVRLGGDGHFRDSGMAWSESRRAIARDVLRAGIFWTADLLEAANELVPLIRSRRPQVLITYNEFGRLRASRPHPGAPGGHVRLPAGRRRRAIGPIWVSPGPSHGCCGTPECVPDARGNPGASRGGGHQDLRGLRSRRRDAADGRREDSAIDVEIDGTGWVQQKLDAMRAHATQITPDGFFFAAEPILGDRMWSHEYYRLAAGEPFPDCGRLGRRPLRRPGR